MAKLEFKEFEPDKQEPLDRCTCPKCGWYGFPSDCTVEEDQESWEMPVYLVYLCPNCDDEEGVEFYPSNEWMDRIEPDKENEWLKDRGGLNHQLTMRGFATKDLLDPPCEDHPGFQMAVKGQKLYVTRLASRKFDKWVYTCQDIERKWPTFYASEDEIELNMSFAKKETNEPT